MNDGIINKHFIVNLLLSPPVIKHSENRTTFGEIMSRV